MNFRLSFAFVIYIFIYNTVPKCLTLFFVPIKSSFDVDLGP